MGHANGFLVECESELWQVFGVYFQHFVQNLFGGGDVVDYGVEEQRLKQAIAVAGHGRFDGEFHLIDVASVEGGQRFGQSADAQRLDAGGIDHGRGLDEDVGRQVVDGAVVEQVDGGHSVQAVGDFGGDDREGEGVGPAARGEEVVQAEFAGEDGLVALGLFVGVPLDAVGGQVAEILPAFVFLVEVAAEVEPFEAAELVGVGDVFADVAVEAAGEVVVDFEELAGEGVLFRVEFGQGLFDEGVEILAGGATSQVEDPGEVVDPGGGDFHIVAVDVEKGIEPEVEGHFDAVTEADDFADIGVALQCQADPVERVGADHCGGLRAERLDVAGDVEVEGDLAQGVEEAAGAAEFAEDLANAVGDRDFEVPLPGGVVAGVDGDDDVVAAGQGLAAVGGRFDSDRLGQDFVDPVGEAGVDVESVFLDIDEAEGAAAHLRVVEDVAQHFGAEGGAGRADDGDGGFGGHSHLLWGWAERISVKFVRGTLIF